MNSPFPTLTDDFEVTRLISPDDLPFFAAAINKRARCRKSFFLSSADIVVSDEVVVDETDEVQVVAELIVVGAVMQGEVVAIVSEVEEQVTFVDEIPKSGNCSLFMSEEFFMETLLSALISFLSLDIDLESTRTSTLDTSDLHSIVGDLGVDGVILGNDSFGVTMFDASLGVGLEFFLMLILNLFLDRSTFSLSSIIKDCF